MLWQTAGNTVLGFSLRVLRCGIVGKPWRRLGVCDFTIREMLGPKLLCLVLDDAGRFRPPAVYPGCAESLRLHDTESMPTGRDRVAALQAEAAENECKQQ